MGHFSFHALNSIIDLGSMFDTIVVTSKVLTHYKNFVIWPR